MQTTVIYTACGRDLSPASMPDATIDFRCTTPPPIRYELVCSEHGALVRDVDRHEAKQVAFIHDGSLHGGEAEWLYDGLSILDSFGEPSATDSPAGVAVAAKRSARQAAQASLL